MYHLLAINLGIHCASKGIIVGPKTTDKVRGHGYQTEREGDVLWMRVVSRDQARDVDDVIRYLGLEVDRRHGRVQSWGIPVVDDNISDSLHGAMPVLRLYDGKTHIFPLVDHRQVSKSGWVTIGHVIVEVLRAR